MEKLKEPVVLILQRGKGLDMTRGVLQHDRKTLCYTLEEPWRDNQKGVSCIPPGVYQVVRHGWEPDATTHFKRVWRLLSVPGREAILIHAGNTLADTEGCILVGMTPAPGGVGQSQAAVNMLRQVLPSAFTLEVRAYL